MAVLDALGHGEVERVDAFDACGLVARNGGSQVACSVGRTATEDRVNDFPRAWLLELGRIGFVGDGQLTASTAVDCGVSAAAQVESEELFGASGHLLAAGGWQRDLVTGEVGAAFLEWRLDGSLGDGLRRGNKQMCACAERQAGGKKCAEHAVRSLIRLRCCSCSRFAKS